MSLFEMSSRIANCSDDSESFETEFPIDKLCDDALVEVFTFLDCENVKSAALVCSKWNELISTAPAVMKKFKLYLCDWSIEDFDESFTSRRRHQNVEIREVELAEAAKILNFFEVSFTRKISFASFKERKAIYVDDVLGILSRMPVLNELKLDNVTLFMKNQAPDPVNLPQLAKFEMASNDCRIFKFITAKNIAKIEVGDKNLVMIETSIESFASFLESCEKLKKLFLQPMIFAGLFELDHRRNFKFELESFEVPHHCYWLYNCEVLSGNFQKFLKIQSKTLKVLKVGELKFTESVIGTIFNELGILSSLAVSGFQLPSHRSFYMNVKAIETLKELIITSGFRTEETPKEILRKCPNIESFRLDTSLEEEVNDLAQLNRKLKMLTVHSINAKLEDNLCFNNLESLKVRSIASIRDLLNVITKSPNLKSLEIEWIEGDEVDDAFVDKLLQHPTLQHLTFKFECGDAIKNVFKKIKNKSVNLKSLVLSKAYSKQILKLELPQDSLDWDVQEEKFKKLFPIIASN